MTEFGETLRNAREAKGLTIQQIAEATNMLPQQIEDLENENFSRIAAPIYGRGFVKLYCGAVGLDPKPLVAEFMDIFNGNKQPTIKFKKTVRNAEPVARESAPAPAVQQQDDAPAIREAAIPPPPSPPPPPPPPQPEPSQPEPPQPEPEPAKAIEEPEFSFAAPSAPTEAPQKTEAFDTSAIRPAAIFPPSPTPEPEARSSAAKDMVRAVEAQPFHLEQETVKSPQTKNTFSASRYSTPPPTLEPDSRYSDFYVPPVVWRVAIVLGVLCLAGWLLFALGSKVWRAATTPPDETPAGEIQDGAPAETAKPNDSAVSGVSSASGQRKERTPMKLPPLYFD